MTEPSTPPPAARRRGFLLFGAVLVAACQAAPAAPGSTSSPHLRTAATPTIEATTRATPADRATEPASPPPTSPVETGAAAFPTVVVDDEGTEVVIDAQPRRVISLSPANTEVVFALGEGDRLVGGTDADDYPTEAAALPDVATFTGVVMERVLALEPDLVLAAGNNFTPAVDIDRMREQDIPVLVLYAETLDEVRGDIGLIGTALGATTAAERLTADIARRADEVRDTVADAARPRVFYQIGSEPEIYGPAPGSFIADMVELAGGDPITTGDPAIFSIPLERLVDEDPEVIVVGDARYGVCAEEVMARPGWVVMTAVRERAVRPVDDIIVTRPGPRIGDGLAALAEAIRPTLDLRAPEPPPCQAAP